VTTAAGNNTEFLLAFTLGQQDGHQYRFVLCTSLPPVVAFRLAQEGGGCTHPVTLEWKATAAKGKGKGKGDY